MKTTTSEYMGIVTTKFFPWLPKDADRQDMAFAAHVAVTSGQIYVNAAPSNMTPDKARQLVDAINQAIKLAETMPTWPTA